MLNISQQPGGLALCTSLLYSHFIGDWAKVDMIVCCEAGGFIYAPVLASQVDVPLALIREAGKLPPPTVSVAKSTSHISSTSNSNEKRIEIERDLIPRNASVVVVDDVLATGNTLCAVLLVLLMSASWLWPSSLFIVADKCYGSMGLASMSKAFWSLMEPRKGSMLESWYFRLAIKFFPFLVLICMHFDTFTNPIYHLLTFDFPSG